MAKTKRIGHITLYEGTNGKWVGMSVGRSDAFERRCRDEISSEEYVKELKLSVEQMHKAHSLLGRKARGS